jgi:hypothetical protein
MLTTVGLWVAWSLPVAIGVGLILRTRKKEIAEEVEAYLRALAGWSPADVVSRIGFGAVSLAAVVAVAGASTMAGPGLPDVDVVSVTRSVRLAMGVETSAFRPAQTTPLAKEVLEEARRAEEDRRRDEEDRRAKQASAEGGDSGVDHVGASLAAAGGSDVTVASDSPLGVGTAPAETVGTVPKNAKDSRSVDLAASKPAESKPTESKPIDASGGTTVRPAASKPEADVAAGPSEAASPAESTLPDPTPPASDAADVGPSPEPQRPPASAASDAADVGPSPEPQRPPASAASTASTASGTTVSRQVARTSAQMTNQSVEVSTTDTTATQAE